MKYVCLGYYDKGKFDGMPEGERNALYDTCFEYDDYLRGNGHFAGGEALQPAETALTLYWKNGKVATTDGPYAETKEQLGGILVLEARDINHAVQLMTRHPALKYGNIFEIRPAGDMNEIVKASERRRRASARERIVSILAFVLAVSIGCLVPKAAAQSEMEGGPNAHREITLSHSCSYEEAWDPSTPNELASRARSTLRMTGERLSSITSGPAVLESAVYKTFAH